MSSAPEFAGYSWVAEDTFQCGAVVDMLHVYRNDAFVRAIGELADGERDSRTEFVLVPGGSFRMGLDPEEIRQLRELNEELDGELEASTPSRHVTVEPFLIARTPLTQQVWDGLAAALGIELWDQRVSESPYLPVHGLTWSFFQDNAVELSLRLPTEAEWEYAARGGSRLSFLWGDTRHAAFEYAWHGHPHEGGPMGVAQKKPNAFGLYDVAGNVWELCQDHWHDDYIGAPSDSSARVDDDDTQQRVMRGGSYRSASLGHLLCAFRSSAGIYFSGDDLGVRPVSALT